jgi:hypothetical protein
MNIKRGVQTSDWCQREFVDLQIVPTIKNAMQGVYLVKGENI